MCCSGEDLGSCSPRLKNTCSHSASPGWPGFHQTAGPVESCRRPHKGVSFVCSPLTNCNSLSLSLWESTRIDSPVLTIFQGHLYDLSSKQLSLPPPFIHLLFQLCEQWCICLQAPCSGKFLQKKTIGKKKSSAFEPIPGFKSFRVYGEHLASSVYSLLTRGMSRILKLISTLGLFPPAFALKQRKINMLIWFPASSKYHKMEPNSVLEFKSLASSPVHRTALGRHCATSFTNATLAFLECSC